MTSHEKVYLKYLRQAADWGLGPDNRRFDVPCERFEKAAERLIQLGFAHRRWIWFGPVGITGKGREALGPRFYLMESR